MSMTSSTRAFTLVEVLIALALIGILTALAYPSYASAIVKSRRAEGKAALLDAMLSQQRYYTDNNRYLPFSAEADQGWRWWSGRAASDSAYELRAVACSGQGLERCIEVHAEPGTARVNRHFRDSECQTLILNSAGEQRATGPGTRCWR